MPDLDKIVRSNISRVVAFVLGPALAIAGAPATNAVNSVFGLGFSDQQVSNVAIAVVVGVALLCWQWLRGRAQFERAAAELWHIYQSGSSVPPAPPKV